MRSIEERKQRWRYLYDGKRKHAVEIVYAPGLPPRPFPLADNLADRGDWALRNYEIMLGQMSWLDSDRIPYFDVYTGTEIFAEAFGCDTYRPKDAMPHAKYLVRSAEEVRAIQAPNLEDTTLMRLFEIADRLRREAGPNAIFKPPDIQSPLGIAALIWDKTDFMASLLLYPDEVRRLEASMGELCGVTDASGYEPQDRRRANGVRLLRGIWNPVRTHESARAGRPAVHMENPLSR